MSPFLSLSLSQVYRSLADKLGMSRYVCEPSASLRRLAWLRYDDRRDTAHRARRSLPIAHSYGMGRVLVGQTLLSDAHGCRASLRLHALDVDRCAATEQVVVDTGERRAAEIEGRPLGW